jgi:gamma-glutamyltranspeptidase/glutathione hydrolase
MSKLKNGIVVAAHPLAAKAGVKILKSGGNAVDAAVATALSLGSVAPAFSGIGGGGFALLWLAREERAAFVDYRERAPQAATANMFEVDTSGNVARSANSEGYLAVATPGTIAGHSFMLEKYGRLKLKEAIQPAIDYARKGIHVTKTLASAWSQSTSKLTRSKDSSSIFLKRGKPYREHDRISFKDLAESLSLIATQGPTEFYTGKIASRICEDMESNNGLLTMQDFEKFTPTEREPVRGSFEGLEVISAPPPSCGGIILLQALNILEQCRLREYDQNSTTALHLTAEALIRSNRSTRQRVCDPDYAKIPVDEMITKKYATSLASDLKTWTTPLSHGTEQPTSSTSHLVVMDSDHNVVSMTESIECYFGSGVVAENTGIILNDTMHDFDPRSGQANSVAPWKIPMSSMSPTILLRGGKPFMAVGAAGASRIISSTLQTILNVVEFHIPLRRAVAAPRIHTQDSLLQMEKGIPRSTINELRGMGHVVETGRRDALWRAGLYFGGVHSAVVKSDNIMEGGSDPRRDGVALGLP